MTLDIYESLTESIEAKLDAADIQAEEISERLSHDDIFDASALRQISPHPFQKEFCRSCGNTSFRNGIN